MLGILFIISIEMLKLKIPTIVDNQPFDLKTFVWKFLTVDFYKFYDYLKGSFPTLRVRPSVRTKHLKMLGMSF